MCLRGAREQPPPHGRGGGAKLQNIVSHRSACKLPGIYLIRGQSVYTRLPFRGREKCPGGRKGQSKRCSASVAALLVFFSFPFSFSFFYPTNSVARLGIPRFRGQFRWTPVQILYSQDRDSYYSWVLLHGPRAYAHGSNNKSSDSTFNFISCVNGDLHLVSTLGWGGLSRKARTIVRAIMGKRSINRLEDSSRGCRKQQPLELPLTSFLFFFF